MTNLLENPGFEGDWWRKTYTGQEFGEIFVPVGWTAFWKEGGPVPHDPSNPIGYGRPEMHVINREPPFLDPLRVHAGSKALKWFTFFRIHEAGVYQQVSGITPGAQLRASGWAHAWSSTQDDPHVSDGVGDEPFFVRAADYNQTDGVRNFTFVVGIDPTGGTDPWGDSVVWGEGAHIYNGFAQIPPVEVAAQGDTVTVFVRSSVLWPFKHCDAYVDEMSLEVIGSPGPGPGPEPEPEPTPTVEVAVLPTRPVMGEPFEVRATNVPEEAALVFGSNDVFWQPPRVSGNTTRWRCVALKANQYQAKVLRGMRVLGSESFYVQGTEKPEPPTKLEFVPPRETYTRTYLLLPPGAEDAWLQAVIDSGAWQRRHWTIGVSADDAGTGPVERRIIAVNPDRWPSDLKAFLDKHYPGAEYVPVTAKTPEDLQRALCKM